MKAYNNHTKKKYSSYWAGSRRNIIIYFYSLRIPYIFKKYESIGSVRGEPVHVVQIDYNNKFLIVYLVIDVHDIQPHSQFNCSSITFADIIINNIEQ